MNYKALEDLINILVKKSGTELDTDRSIVEESKLKSKISKLRREYESFQKSISSKLYKDNNSKELDETKKTYLEKVIQSLEMSLKTLKEELDTFDVKDERGETAYAAALISIKGLEDRKKIFKREMDYAKAKDNEEFKELSNKFRDIQKEIKSHRKIVDRKRFLEEEIARINDEIEKYKNLLENIKNKINSNTYDDNFSKTNDDFISQEKAREIENLEKIIENWGRMPEILGKEILKAYSEEKEFKDIELTIDILMEKASNEYLLTKDEIEGSNIFQEMEKYNKLITDLKNKTKNNDYGNKKVVVYDTEKESYYRKRIDELKTQLKSLDDRKQVVISKIKDTKEISDDFKNKRFELENSLEVLKERLNTSSTKKLPIEETKEIDRLIINIEEDIESQRELEEGNVLDTYLFKDELKRIDIDMIAIRKVLSTFENNLQRLAKNKNTNDADKIEMLEDKILIIEFNNRLESLRNQQQYLYVDPSVIKDEIKLIWDRAKGEGAYSSAYEETEESNNVSQDAELESYDEEDEEEAADELFDDFKEIEEEPEEEFELEEFEPTLKDKKTSEIESLELDALIEDIEGDL